MSLPTCWPELKSNGQNTLMSVSSIQHQAITFLMTKTHWGDAHVITKRFPGVKCLDHSWSDFIAWHLPNVWGDS